MSVSDYVRIEGPSDEDHLHALMLLQTRFLMEQKQAECEVEAARNRVNVAAAMVTTMRARIAALQEKIGVEKFADPTPAETEGGEG